MEYDDNASPATAAASGLLSRRLTFPISTRKLSEGDRRIAARSDSEAKMVERQRGQHERLEEQSQLSKHSE